LKDILKTACNITSATYKGVGGWRERVGGLMMPVDTGNQVVCTVATVALTIPQAMQMYNGTELDSKLPY